MASIAAAAAAAELMLEHSLLLCSVRQVRSGVEWLADFACCAELQMDADGLGLAKEEDGMDGPTD